MSRYDAVVFDNDGVLVELTDTVVLRDAAREAFVDVGVDDPDPTFLDHAVNGTLDGLDAIEDEYGVAVSEYWSAREHRAIEHQRADIRDGGKPLFDDVAALRELPHRMGVASNNQHETVSFIVEHYGLSDVFETVYGREPTVAGAARRKPDPHYVDVALADLSAKNALYVGDSPKDVVAAERAGADSAYIRRPHRSEVEPEIEPTYRVASLRELVDVLSG